MDTMPNLRTLTDAEADIILDTIDAVRRAVPTARIASLANLGCLFVPGAAGSRTYRTIPLMLPKAKNKTAAAKDYVAIVEAARKSIGKRDDVLGFDFFASACPLSNPKTGNMMGVLAFVFP